MQLVPSKIKLAGENNTIEVQWSDGHVSAYPYRYLRDKCPCATCTDAGHGASSQSIGGVLPILGAKPLRPERAELVGRYGLQIYWSDGHSTGIYGFNLLRELCSCAECMARREAG